MCDRKSDFNMYVSHQILSRSHYLVDAFHIKGAVCNFVTVFKDKNTGNTLQQGALDIYIS